MTDKFKCFSELKAHVPAKGNWVIHTSDSNSPVLVMAIHGGSIEPGTTMLASDLSALGEYNFYTFEALCSEVVASDLHITSSNFDEPNARRMVYEAEIVISLHGCKGDEPVVYIGGGIPAPKRMRLTELLVEAGFSVAEHAHPGLQGKSPYNICNLGLNPGLQLELTRGLRDQLDEDEYEREIFLNALHEWVKDFD